MMKEVRKWFSKAEDDFKKAKDNFNIKNYDIASFLCQQSVEKAFKALLIKRPSEFPNIHDLVRLGKELEVPENIGEDIKELTLAYIYTRYPDIGEISNIKEKASSFLKLNENILK